MPPLNEELITEAIAAHRNGLSLRKTAETFGIDRKTLSMRMKGRQTRSEANVDSQRLSPVQEDRLAIWIIGQEALGYVPFHVQVRMIVSRLLAKQGDTSPIG